MCMLSTSCIQIVQTSTLVYNPALIYCNQRLGGECECACMGSNGNYVQQTGQGRDGNNSSEQFSENIQYDPQGNHESTPQICVIQLLPGRKSEGSGPELDLAAIIHDVLVKQEQKFSFQLVEVGSQFEMGNVMPREIK